MKRHLVFLFIILLLIATPNLALAEEATDDITGHYFENSMRALVSQNILGGYGEGVYKPDRLVTRAEFTTFLVRSLSLSETSPAPTFTDVNPGEWYYSSVRTAGSHKIIGGYSDGSFQPNKVISRQEMAAMIKRAIDSQRISTELAPLQFKDNAEINPMFQPSIQSLISLGILSGKKDSKGNLIFAPKDNTTRGEISAIIVRMLRVIDEQSKAPVPTSKISTVPYDRDYNSVIDLQTTKNPKVDGAGSLTASRELVEYYANPLNFPEDSPEFFQYLVLSYSPEISATMINEKILNGKGSLAGTGQAFIQAGETFNINPIYLIAHALHETGNGTSTLASGYEVSGMPTYNMYGIQAFDSCPISCGSQFAYEQQWFTPEAAIIGGAKFINNGYIGAGQNTLYKMRWNPDNPGTHQYASHVSWSVIQARKIYNIYNDNDFLSTVNMNFEVPKYLNQTGETNLPTGDTIYAVNPALKDVIGTTTDNLNFRTVPVISASNVIEVIPSGSKITIIGQNGSWYKVTYNEKTGWVYNMYIKFDNLLQVVDVPTTLNVRETPSLDAKIVGSLKNNDLVRGVLDPEDNFIIQDGWYQIYFNGVTSWVHGDFVKVK